MFSKSFFRNSWGHSTIHRIEGDFIVGTGDKEYFNPWNYAKEVPRDVLQNIFGKKEFQPMGLPSTFASINIDNNEEILSWCNHFGFPMGTSERFHLNTFKQFICEFHWVYSLAVQLRTSTEEALSRYILSMRQMDEGVARIISETDARKNPHLVAKSYIVFVVNSYINRSTWPDFQYGEEEQLSLTWRVISLISQLYFMFGLDFSTGRIPIRCGFRKCSKYFIPQNERNLYCCTACKSAEQQARLNEKKDRKRIDAALSAIAAGTSLQEVSKKFKFTVPRLKRIILYQKAKEASHNEWID